MVKRDVGRRSMLRFYVKILVRVGFPRFARELTKNEENSLENPSLTPRFCVDVPQTYR